jgi:hypothetical protein
VEVCFIKALRDAQLFFRGEINLLSLCAIPQCCIVNQNLIFCHFVLSFKIAAYAGLFAQPISASAAG